MSTTFRQRDRPLTHGGLVRTDRFIYDLGEVIAKLKCHAFLPTQDVKDWIIEELRDYCLIDVSTYTGTHPTYSGVHPLEVFNTRLVSAIHSRLYKLFSPMSFKAHRSDFVDVLFPKDVLTVTLYDLAQY